MIVFRTYAIEDRKMAYKMAISSLLFAIIVYVVHTRICYNVTRIYMCVFD